MTDTAAAEMARSARGRHTPLVPRIDYAERLFKIEQIKHKRRLCIDYFHTMQDKGESTLHIRDELEQMNNEISKLLEDEQ